MNAKYGEKTQSISQGRHILSKRHHLPTEAEDFLDNYQNTRVNYKYHIRSKMSNI